MRYREGHCRTPWHLLPDRLDDDVTEDQAVCFIEADVERVGLIRFGFARAQATFTGRSAYDPRDWLELSIYGYLTRIRFSPRPEQETHRHVELIWLLRKLRPDFKPLADLKQHHTKALQALFREFVPLSRQLALFGAALLAMDGRQFKAVNTTHQHLTRATLEKSLKDIDEKVEQDLRNPDAATTAGGPQRGRASPRRLPPAENRAKLSQWLIHRIAT